VFWKLRSSQEMLPWLFHTCFPYLGNRVDLDGPVMVPAMLTASFRKNLDYSVHLTLLAPGSGLT
jgi:hypothetical protein